MSDVDVFVFFLVALAPCRDFVEARSADEIRDIFASCGYTLDDAEFRAVYKRAATHYDLNRNGIVSVEEFRLALNEYSDAIDDGEVPGWFHEFAREEDDDDAAAS